MTMTIKGDGIITGSTAPCFRAAVTYSTKAWSTANTSMVQLQVNAEYSSITLMEIAA